MSEKECLTADWQDQGYRDGRQGFPVSRVMDHQEACSKIGIVPNMVRYRTGHEQGVLEYCTVENAVIEGRAGRSYRNACPAQLEGKFLKHHELGMRVYRAEEKLNDLHRQSRQLQHSLDKEKNEAKRRKLRNDLSDLDGRMRWARDELHHAEQQLR